MDFGVTNPVLKQLAEKPVIKPLLVLQTASESLQTEWLGGRFKTIETLGEQSAAGLKEKKGAVLVGFLPNALLAKSVLNIGDVVLQLGDEEIVKAGDLLKAYEAVKWMGTVGVKLVRNQQEMQVQVDFK
jgi:S1-C subfamily serine protease